jgi:Trk K+ transport system NAD-binding subunit
VGRRSKSQDARRFHVSLRERARYRFDNVLARGTGAALFWLGAVTIGAVLVSSLLLTVFGVTLSGSEGGSWLEDFWQSLLRILDTGTMAGDVGWGRRLLALLVTLFGVLIAGTLIGIIAAGVEDRIDSMRRGRSVVIESGHLVILGGPKRVPAIVEQLVLGDADHGPDTIVILSPVDPTELRRSVLEMVPDLYDTRVVYRYGDPRVRADVALARVGEARGVIVLPQQDGDDVSVVHTVLALNGELGGLEATRVVAEVRDPMTAERLVQACGPGMHPIATAQAIARTAAFALRQPGLSRVVDELLDFHGCDLHVIDRPELLGVRFDEIVGRFANARPLGFRRRDGRVELDPPPESAMETGDRLVVLADDIERLEPDETAPRLERGGESARRSTRVLAPVEEHILVVGWNPLGAHLLTGWAARAASSSTVKVAFDPRLIDQAEVVVPDIGVEVALSTTVETSMLELEPAPTTVVVLGYTSVDTDEADARTMLDVMQLRRRCAQTGDTPRLVVQMLDEEHADLADLTGPDDFLISEALGSQVLARLIEQPERRDVLLELYGGGDASIRMVRCELLGLVGAFTMQDVVAAAYAGGVLAIGWRQTADGVARVVLNPDSSDRVVLSPSDEIVVVG